MRILQAHNRHSARGGADQVVEEEGAILSEAGHDVEHYLLAPAAGGSGLRQAADAVWNTRACAEVADLIRSFRPDVMHVHTPFPLLSPAVFRVAAKLQCPSVTTLHSYRYSCVAGTCRRDDRPCEDCVGKRLKLPGIRHGCYHDSVAASSALTLSLVSHRAAGTFSRHVARYIALTDFAKALLIRDNFPADRVVVKPNAVADPGTPGPRSGELSYALYAGRFVEEKGIRTLLDAWRYRRDTDAGDRLVPLKIAGDGPLRPLVEAAAADNPQIEYVGWLDSDAMLGLLRGADLLVFPSEWYEAQPLVMLQAAAAGVPVVCSDLENISASFVAAGAGVSFATRDPGSLRRTTSDLLARPDELWAMGARARAMYEAKHTPQRSLEGLERVYAGVIG